MAYFEGVNVREDDFTAMILNKNNMLSELKSKNAELHNLKGLNFNAEESYVEAIAEFTRAIYFNPDEAIYYWHRAEAYFKLYDFESSILNFRRFEHLVTSSYVSKRFTKLLFTWAQILIDLESFKQSIRYLEECSLRGFSRKLVSTRLVLSYIGLQNIEKALEYLNILVDMGDADINIYVLRCRILLHLEKWFEAASDLKVATNINPSHVTLYELKLQILQHAVTLKNEANSCISRDDLKCAESFLDQALKLDEDDWRAIFVRGTLLKRLNMLPECLQDLMTVFSFQGRDGEKQDEITRQLAEANNQLGLNYFKAGKLAEAKAKFDTAISYDPKDLLVLKNLAAYRYRIDDIEGEIQDHLVILSIDTEDVASAKRLSDIYLKIGKDWNSQGKFEEAIRSLTNSIKYCSDCDEAYYERARSYLDLNNLKLMQTDLKKCLKLNPKHAMANGMFSIHAERPLNKSFLPFPPKDPHKLAAIEEIRLAFSNIQIQKSSSRKTAGPQLKCSEYNMSLKTLLPNPGFAKGKNK